MVTPSLASLLGLAVGGGLPTTAPERVLAAPSAVLTRRDSVKAVAQRGEVLVDFVRPDGGIGTVLEQRVDIEAPGGASAAATRRALVLVGCRVEVVRDPGHNIVDQFAVVRARPGPRLLVP